MNFLVYLTVFFFSLHINADEINLYTTRHYDSDIKLYKDFTQQTGINVNIISGKAKPLEKRILEECYLFLTSSNHLKKMVFLKRLVQKFWKKKYQLSLGLIIGLE